MVAREMGMVGRQALVEAVVTRLVHPDDVRSNPKEFLWPGFYGVGGVGKTRLLTATAARVATVTPYIVRVDFANPAAPGTPLALVQWLVDELETQEQAQWPRWKRLTWGRNNPFRACRQVLDEESRRVSINQTMVFTNSDVADVEQSVDQGGNVPPRVGQALAGALEHLHVRGATQRRYGGLGPPEPRPLVVLLLDAVELAPGPLRRWLPRLPALFGGKNRSTFHALVVAAGRQKIVLEGQSEHSGFLATPLPPLTPSEADGFVRAYITHVEAQDWARRVASLQQFRAPALHNSIIAAGAGIPLLLQGLVDAALLKPEGFAVLADELPDVQEERTRYVWQQVLERLKAQAEAQGDALLWERYRLLLYSAVPRQVVGEGLLRALLLDLPGSPFTSRTNYAVLWQRLAAEPFVERTAEGALRFHDLVREGTLAYLQRHYPETWLALHRRAAAWFQAQPGQEVEGFYHAVQADYEGTIGALWRRIEATLAREEWPEVQALLDTTRAVTLRAADEPWLTLYKADLAWGEGNQALALQRLRRLYGDEVHEPVQEQALLRQERWLGFHLTEGEEAPDAQSALPPNRFMQDLLWWARVRNQPQLQVAALLRLGDVARFEDRLSTAQQHFEQALTLAQELGERRQQTEALFGLGHIAQEARLSAAQQHYEQALELAQGLDDRRQQAHALLHLGEAALQQNRKDEAQQLYQQALTLAQRVDDRGRQVQALLHLGTIARVESRWGTAQQHYEQALTLAQGLDDRRQQAAALCGLGEVARVESRWGTAQQHYEQALTLAQGLDDRGQQAAALGGLGEIARVQHRWGAAQQHYEQALTLAQGLDDRQQQVCVLRGLGEVARVQHRWSAAQQHWEQALTLAQGLDDRQQQAAALAGLGQVALEQARWSVAQEHLEQALTLAQGLDDQGQQAAALCGLGEVALQQARLSDAQGYYEQALELARGLAHQRRQAYALSGLGEVALQQARLSDAQEHWDQMLTLWREIGLAQEVLNWSIFLGGQVLNHCDTHRTAGNEEAAQEALALAQHLYGWGRSVVGEVRDVDNVSQLVTGFHACRTRLARYFPNDSFFV